MEKGVLESQKMNTRLSQELADLKAKYPGAEASDPSTTEAPSSVQPLEVKAPPKAPEGTPMDFAAICKKVGVSEETIVDEWTQGGKLSDATAKSFANGGYDPNFVSTVVGGIKFKADKMLADSVKIIGSDEQYNNLMAWASTALTEDQRIEVNKDLRNEHKSEFALRGLMAKYQSTLGIDTPGASFVNGQATPGGIAAPTSLEAYNKLGALAQQGDVNAARIVDSLTRGQINALPLHD